MIRSAIEVLDIKTFSEHYSSKLKNYFTKDEIDKNRRKPNPNLSFAARLALKFAYRKVLRFLTHIEIPFNQIEVFTKKNGEPSLRILSNKKIPMIYKKCCASLTHTHEAAAAVVTLEVE